MLLLMMIVVNIIAIDVDTRQYYPAWYDESNPNQGPYRGQPEQIHLSYAGTVYTFLSYLLNKSKFGDPMS